VHVVWLHVAVRTINVDIENVLYLHVFQFTEWIRLVSYSEIIQSHSVHIAVVHTSEADQILPYYMAQIISKIG